MAEFLINWQKREYRRQYENAFLWHEDNSYVMASHRLALWCWLQSDYILNKEHVLIHIDQHLDAREWFGAEEQCLKQALDNFADLKELPSYEQLQCVPRPNSGWEKKTRPCITYDNFVFLAAKASLFRHYYFFEHPILNTDWKAGVPEEKYNRYQSISDVNNLAGLIEKNASKCVIDVDLDFFDGFDSLDRNPGKISADELLESVFATIANQKEMVSCITIALNESPQDRDWKTRERQLAVIKEILNLHIPLPIRAITNNVDNG